MGTSRYESSLREMPVPNPTMSSQGGVTNDVAHPTYPNESGPPKGVHTSSRLGAAAASTSAGQSISASPSSSSPLAHCGGTGGSVSSVSPGVRQPGSAG